MQSDSNLRETLRSIDHKSYPAYKSLRGSYRVFEKKFTGLQTMCYPSIMCREILLRHLPMCA